MDPTHATTKPTRRRTLLAALSLAPLGALGWAMARRSSGRVRTRHHRTSPPSADGLVVDGPVALWRDVDGLHAVSRRCPHLGCQVQPTTEGTLACPCHGSRFDDHGRLTGGPARADLERLTVTVEADGTIVVDLAG